MTAPSTESGVPFVPPTIVVGGDRLALSVCAILDEYDDERAVLLWTSDPALENRADRDGVAFVSGDATENEALERAGIREAAAIMLLADDDHFNLEAAMRARDLNPDVRIVMRQFNRELGRKIAKNLANCSVVSLAAQSAATFASVAVDPYCFYGVQFPDIDGPLFAFSRHVASEAGCSGETVAAAEERLDRRIVAVDGKLVTERPADEPLGPDADVVCVRETTVASRPFVRAPVIHPRRVAHAARWAVRRLDPLALRLGILTVVVFLVATAYFAGALHLGPMTAAYFVTTMMTTTGFGDIVPKPGAAAQHLVAMFTMVAGVAITGLFVALFTSYFTAAQNYLLQGVRRIESHDHVVVCGAGKVGSRVIDFLLDLGRDVVVIERDPTPALIDLARRRKIQLMTGDATADETLDHCNLGAAFSVVAATENDTVNLEVGLGARRFNATIPAVLRVAERDFAQSITRHFGLRRTFSTAAIAAPVFVGLSRWSGARGHLVIGAREFGLAEVTRGDTTLNVEEIAGTLPLARWRDGRASLQRDFENLEDGDRVLYLYPVYRFKRPSVSR